MTVRYTSTAPGRFAGVEIDDEATAFAWQTAGHRVGRFGRPLSVKERARLDRALRAARKATPATAPAGARRPGGSTEQVTADGLPDLIVTGTPPAGFGKLVDHLRRLLEVLAENPLAAVELEIVGSPPGAALRHVGDEPVDVRIGALTVRATVFDDGSAIVYSADETVDAAGVGDRLKPGWRLSLAGDLGLPAIPPAGFATVTVGGAELDVLGDGVLRPVEFGWTSQ